MRLIEPRVEIIREPDMAKRIEIAARCCYKSEDKITDGSAMKMVKALIKRGHESPLEHSNILVVTYTPEATNALRDMIAQYEYETGIPSYIRNSGSHSKALGYANPIWGGNLRAWRSLAKMFYNDPFFEMLFMNHPLFEDVFSKVSHNQESYINAVDDCYDMYADSTSTRIAGVLNPTDANGIYDLKAVYQNITALADTETIDPDFYNIMTVRIVADRGVQNELVRHRLLSPSVESTRYCNYGGGLTCIEPWWYADANEAETSAFGSIIRDSESDYDYMQNNMKSPAPQKSRAVLPLATKSEGIYTGTIAYWKHHVIPLRKSAAAHPDMQRVMRMLCEKMG